MFLTPLKCSVCVFGGGGDGEKSLHFSPVGELYVLSAWLFFFLVSETMLVFVG